SHCSLHHRDLHSFPTRRSSDLIYATASKPRQSKSLRASSTHLCVDGKRWVPAVGRDDLGNAILLCLLSNALNVLNWILKLFHSRDRKSTRLNSSHSQISYAVFC